MIVSIGGIELKSKGTSLRFFWYALKTLRIAKKSRGCLHASIFQESNVYFALSVWDTPEDKQAYGRSESHVSAVRKTGKLVVSATNHSYETSALPERSDVIAAWRTSTC